MGISAVFSYPGSTNNAGVVTQTVGGGITEYASASDLPYIGNTDGDLARVEGSNGLLIWSDVMESWVIPETYNENMTVLAQFEGDEVDAIELTANTGNWSVYDASSRVTFNDDGFLHIDTTPNLSDANPTYVQTSSLPSFDSNSGYSLVFRGGVSAYGGTNYRIASVVSPGDGLDSFYLNMRVSSDNLLIQNATAEIGTKLLPQSASEVRLIEIRRDIGANFVEVYVDGQAYAYVLTSLLPTTTFQGVSYGDFTSNAGADSKVQKLRLATW